MNSSASIPVDSVTPCKIEVLKPGCITDQLLCQIEGLMEQLTEDECKLQKGYVLNVADASDILLAFDGETAVGMMTICIYDSLTGRKAWIEDFVVDERYRGTGVASLLFEKAVQLMRQNGVSTLNLTSKPSRAAAHAFYRKHGMQQRRTDVFRMNL